MEMVDLEKSKICEYEKSLSEFNKLYLFSPITSFWKEELFEKNQSL